MPIATPEKYAEMLDAAKAGSFAFPAINVTSSQSLNAAIAGFAEAGSDGIVQVSFLAVASTPAVPVEVVGVPTTAALSSTCARSSFTTTLVTADFDGFFAVTV